MASSSRPSPIGNKEQCDNANAQTKAVIQLAKEAWFNPYGSVSRLPVFKESVTNQNTPKITKIHGGWDFRKHYDVDRYFHYHEYDDDEEWCQTIELLKDGTTMEIIIRPYPHPAPAPWHLHARLIHAPEEIRDNPTSRVCYVHSVQAP